MNYYLDLHLVSVHQFLIQVIKISYSFMTGLFFNSREMFDHMMTFFSKQNLPQYNNVKIT